MFVGFGPDHVGLPWSCGINLDLCSYCGYNNSALLLSLVEYMCGHFKKNG